ncbi:MAG TPA: CatB-related O-acetyltransferase [Candidatus Binataceae bacterium]|nr:CatB-related O-acetyltransferase [Candidatus Binataceae bacterium]
MRAHAAMLYTSLRHRNLVRGSQCIIPRRCSIAGATSFGKAVVLGQGVRLRDTHIGDYSYLGTDCNVTKAVIGKFCSIASGVYIGLGSHPLAPFVSTHPIFYLRRLHAGWDFADRDYRSEYADTAIGNDVWIGLRSAVRDGIAVGDGAVIAAGAVVTKDVPPYAIVVGVPARILRYRFPPETIQLLLEFKWWDRDKQWLRQHWQTFHDAGRFVHEFQPALIGTPFAATANGRIAI